MSVGETFWLLLISVSGVLCNDVRTVQDVVSCDDVIMVMVLCDIVGAVSVELCNDKRMVANYCETTISRYLFTL